MTGAARRRVLIVTSAFPPAMLADMQRARMLAYDLPESGWDVEVLTPSIEYQQPDWIEPDAEVFLPPKAKVHYVPQWCAGWFRVFRIGSVGWRVFWPMYRVGCRLLRRRHFDLIYITTAQFSLFCLGRIWRYKFGTPYILDFHDPWFLETHKYLTTSHRFKFWVSSWLSKHLERFALRHGAGLVSVSPTYFDMLEQRYPTYRCVQPQRRAVIPIGAAPSDLNTASKIASVGTDKDPYPIEIVYVGGGGPIMAKSFHRVVRTLARLRKTDSELLSRVRIRLWGTQAYWESGETKGLQTIAKSVGLSDLVDEQPARVCYLKALNLILHANGLLILGVDDPAYMPSKLFLYALSGRPVLVCLHRDSQASRYFQDFPGLGRLINFEIEDSQEIEQDTEVRMFLVEAAREQRFNRTSELYPFLSSSGARRHVELFEACLN